MPNISFEELADAGGVDVTAGLARIYERARALWHPKPIVFDLAFEHPTSSGGMRSYRDRIQIWSARRADRVATLIHELAHAVIDRERRSPRLNPDAPPMPERMILSDLIGIPEHVLVHELMAEYGVDATAEARDRSRNFIGNVRAVPLGPSGDNIHLAVGYAMMQTAFRYENNLPDLRRAVESKSGVVARLGDALASYVLSERDTSLYEDAQALMQIADIRPDYRMCVFSQEQFERQYGWL